MSAVKLILGFIVGLLACAVLLAIISIKEPILAEDAKIRNSGTIETVVAGNDNNEQNVNTEGDLASSPKEDDVAEQQLDADEAQPEMEAKPDEMVKPEPKENVGQEEAKDQPLPENADEPAAETKTTELPVVGGDSSGNTIELGAGSSSSLPTITSDGSSNRLKLESEKKAEEDSASTGDSSVRAIQRNAEPFINIGRPVMSIVLQDVGLNGETIENLINMAVPFTFAVDGSHPDAGSRGQRYKDSGFEVVTLMPLDDFQKIQESADLTGDIEKILGGYFRSMPMSLGLLDDPVALLQKERKIFLPVLAELSKTGHGLLTYKKGLNTTVREANKLDVQSSTVFRILDANNEDLATIERYLNRAVLEANQEGGVIVMGKSTVSTISAIQAWLESPRAEGVSMAPVSAAMLNESLR